MKRNIQIWSLFFVFFFESEIMEKGSIIILKEFDRFSSSITCYNRENFHNIRDRKFWRNIGVTLFFTLCFVMLVLILVAAIWYCFDCHWDIQESSMAVPIAISIVQMIFMYLAIISNNRTISEMIFDVQKIVERRKLFGIFSIFMDISS